VEERNAQEREEKEERQERVEKSHTDAKQSFYIIL
jgi:hypothetical protein